MAVEKAKEEELRQVFIGKANRGLGFPTWKPNRGPQPPLKEQPTNSEKDGEDICPESSAQPIEARPDRRKLTDAAQS